MMADTPRGTGIVRTAALRSGADPLTVIVVGVLIITVLYFGREIFMPIALAVLLSFALAPVVRRFRLWHLPRVAAVLTAVLFAFLFVAGLTWLMAVQVTELARDLPRYQETMREKIVSLKGAAAASDAMETASGVLERLSQEIARPNPSNAPVVTDGGDARTPVPVVLREPPPGPLDTLASLIEPLIHPFAITGIVIIFVIFILLQREDLRNRFIKLVGAGDLQKATAALDDAAGRLSRLLLTQLLMNTVFGIVIGVGLTLIGVPIAALWGMLAGILRFVPYIGGIIAAGLPVALAAAVDPGWSMLWQAALLFLVAETVTGHFIEPMLYGRSTGLSPVAVVVAATFWTWLWGPVGLVLSTPMTVCVMVLGRHVKGLAFIELLLGDRPALSPAELFYQRMLAGDATEVTAVAEELLKERSLSEYYDSIALPGLRLAQVDLDRGALDQRALVRIRDTVEEVIENLDTYEDRAPDTAPRRAEGAEAEAAVEAVPDRDELPVFAQGDLPEEWRGRLPVLCLAVATPLDEAAAMMLARLLVKHGIGARAETPDAMSARRLEELPAGGTAVVCLCAFGAPEAQMRYAQRRIRRHLSGASVIACDFAGPASVSPDGRASGALRAALASVIALLPPRPQAPLSAAEPAGADPVGDWNPLSPIGDVTAAPAT